MAADDERGVLTHVQSKLKAASSHCEAGTFDLHLLPNVAWETDAAGRRTGRHEISLIPVLLKPRGHGVVRLRSADPAVVPEIDQRLFSDPDGIDAAVLAEGVELACAVAATGPLGELLSGPAAPDALPSEAWTLFHRRAPAAWERPARPTRWSIPTAACRESTGSVSRTRPSSRPSRAPTRI